ncbi:MAG TPA: DUF3822 family protein [Flavitalea sp.]|nr:DUF3822 family protein [Flavitalea sp.]
MIRPAFDIVYPNLTDEARMQCQLVIEISDRLFSYILFNREEKSLFCLRQYHFDWIAKNTTAEQLEQLINLDPYLQHPVKDVVVIYNYPESNLIPEQHFHISMNKSLTELVYGHAKKGLVVSEKVKGWDLYNVYRIPREVHTRMQQRFSAGKYWHFYTLLLSGDKMTEKDRCMLVFYSDRFICRLFSKGRLQMMQTWLYETPEDVSYYLLSLCTQFGLNQETFPLKLSGLIDEKSTLYTELMKYFQHVEADQVPDDIHTNQLLDEYPAHYFSPLLKMAECV